MLPCEAWTDTIEEKLRSRRRSWDVDVDVDVDVAMVCNSVRKWDLQMCCWAVMVQKTEHKCDLDCVQYASILALPLLAAPTAVLRIHAIFGRALPPRTPQRTAVYKLQQTKIP